MKYMFSELDSLVEWAEDDLTRTIAINPRTEHEQFTGHLKFSGGKNPVPQYHGNCLYASITPDIISLSKVVFKHGNKVVGIQLTYFPKTKALRCFKGKFPEDNQGSFFWTDKETTFNGTCVDGIPCGPGILKDRNG